MKMNRKQLAEHVGSIISEDRERTHGSPQVQFACAQELKDVIRTWKDGRAMNPVAEEALDLVCTKLARIICGKNVKDHWIDIAGYELLAAEAAE